MINVLVVEDEPPILKSICRNIEKVNSNFYIIGTAYDGKEAIKIISNSTVDVLITDIHMPIMNGLELLEYVESNYPSIIKLVISGYEDFNYAKKAFQSGIFDYLLKPIDKEIFKNQLNKIYTQITESRYEVIKERLYNEIYTIPQNSIYDHYLNESKFKILLLCSGTFPISEYDYLLPGKYYWEKYDLKRICQRFLTDTTFWVLPGKSSVERIIIVSTKTSFNENQFLNLFNHLNKLDKIPITLCSSPIIRDISTLSKVHHQQRIALHNSIIFSKASIIEYNPDISDKKLDSRFISINQEFKSDITTLKNDMIQPFILKNLDDVLKIETFQIDLEAYLHFTFYILSENTSGNQLLLNIDKIIKELITNSFTKSDMINGISEILSDLLKPQSSKVTQKEQLVKDMADFIILNYNKPITNQTLSDKFGLVPSYISYIFKNHIGITPSEYILKYRMEKAKELLNTDFNLLTKDIAEIVGYSDPLYFSRVFKKYFGENPTDIKKC